MKSPVHVVSVDGGAEKAYLNFERAAVNTSWGSIVWTLKQAWPEHFP